MQADIMQFLSSIQSNEPVPPSVLSFPSMMSKNEKSLLYWLARSYYRGEGTIVDAGLFLGASTEAFSIGLKNNPSAYAAARERLKRPIHAYDIAIWAGTGFDKYLEQPETQRALNGSTFREGDNYFPVLQRLLEPHLNLIDFRIGDIVKLARADGPIEIAFYDCLKNYERDLAAFNAFAPHYIPGHTVVIQQDYFFEAALENKIRQEFLSPYFSFLGAVDTSGVFRFEREIPAEYFEEDPIKALSVDDQVRLLKNAAARVPLSKVSLYTELSVVALLIQYNRIDEADAYLAGIEKVILETKNLPLRPGIVATSMRKLIEARTI
jgi:hypothetical protein